MVDAVKKKKIEGEKYSISEATQALINTLKETNFPIDYDSLIFKYHIDIGILVRLISKGIPNFVVGTSWLSDATGYDWLVNSIEPIEDGKVYEVVFILEVEI